MKKLISRVGVFCGASVGKTAIYAEAAVDLVDAMADRGLVLVYGGSNIGIMGTIANHMLAKGGDVIGVIPQSLVDVELAHQGLTQLHIVNSMHERKALMESLADGFIMFPGGTGTLDEFFEVLTWAQLSHHFKPCGILNVNGYYDFLIQFLDHATEQGFLRQVYRDIIIIEQSPQLLLEKFHEYEAPTVKKYPERR